MKLIIENTAYGSYAYIETEKQFKSIEKHRGGIRLPVSQLNNECNLEEYPNSYFVFNLTKKQQKV